ncbi:sugar ABC transporter permease [Brachybacterium huguangmaarense]|uniref:Sugar ABC transporter permease n=1 Tax=Brachybacterium huguangmaarense TaxID=1652028 RepID=A0ABY6G3I3_9MICO|nr:sugar ABC transporter permease [Brachybacterium huguangmaarense]UYG17191.1 sugar ABC transporter permease [Brachybacterium huguangmaarense]
MRTRTPAASRGAVWFTVPYLAVFALFLIWPIVYGIWMSITDQSLAATRVRVLGLANYLEALTDPDVWSSLGTTVVFTVMSSVPLVILSFLLAYLVSTGLPGQWLWRLAFFAPYLLPVSVVTGIWGMVYANDFGLLNGLLLHLGLDQIPWLSDKHVAMWSIALVTVWWTVGFNFLLYLSALQAIPDHVYEAAQIDGAGPLRRLWSVTLPLMRPTTVLIVLLQLLASMKVFDQVFLLTTGGPDGATRVILQYIYDVGFSGYRVGYAASVSYLFFALIVVLSLAQVAITRRLSKES